MNVRMLSLATVAFLVYSNSHQVRASDSTVRDPRTVVKIGDVVLVNVTKILESVDESHPQFARSKKIKLGDECELGAWPITVLQNGTIALPLLKPIAALGLSIEDLEKRILESYEDARILRPSEVKVVAARMTEK